MVTAHRPEAVSRALKAFITRDLMRRPDYPLEDDEPLMSGGLIDSFCVAHIGVFVEMQFQIYIPDAELTVERMDTVRQIVGRVLQGSAP